MTSHYNLVEYDAEEERLKDPAGKPANNLIAGSFYIAKVLTANKIPWAVMGGFAMICRGSRRTTRDIDIVTATAMSMLWKVFEAQTRLIVPNTRLIEGVLKVFLKTGPTYGDIDCTIDREIEVDLVMPAKFSLLDGTKSFVSLTVQKEPRERPYDY